MNPDTTPDLSTNIGRLRFEFLAWNASGPWCTEYPELEALARSEAGAVLLKSATLEPRAGNPEPRIHASAASHTSINAVGLANLGYEAHARQIERLKREHPGRPFLASVAGLSPEHFPIMARRLGEVADALEINLSCPNVAGKPQLALDPDAARQVLGEVRRATDADLWVKLPPYQDRAQVERMSGILLEARVQAVVCINSPSGLDIDLDAESVRIAPNGGMGGIGGDDILRIALWNVRQFALALDGRIPVIGCGGVRSAATIYQHVLAGASAVEVGTDYLIDGPGVFGRLRRELRGFLAERGVSRLLDKQGKLNGSPEGQRPFGGRGQSPPSAGLRPAPARACSPGPADLIRDCGALKTEGPYRLKSGEVSDYFFDLSQCASAAHLKELGSRMAELVSATFGAPDFVFGPAYKAIPLATMVARELGAGLRFDRKEEKSYGENTGGGSGHRIIGPPIPAGATIVVIDDVFSTGDTKVQAIRELRKAQPEARILGVAVVLDRQAPAPGSSMTQAQLFAREHGVPVAALLRSDQLGLVRKESNTP